MMWEIRQFVAESEVTRANPSQPLTTHTIREGFQNTLHRDAIRLATMELEVRQYAGRLYRRIQELVKEVTAFG